MRICEQMRTWKICSILLFGALMLSSSEARPPAENYDFYYNGSSPYDLFVAYNKDDNSNIIYDPEIQVIRFGSIKFNVSNKSVFINGTCFNNSSLLNSEYRGLLRLVRLSAVTCSPEYRSPASATRNLENVVTVNIHAESKFVKTTSRTNISNIYNIGNVTCEVSWEFENTSFDVGVKIRSTSGRVAPEKAFACLLKADLALRGYYGAISAPTSAVVNTPFEKGICPDKGINRCLLPVLRYQMTLECMDRLLEARMRAKRVETRQIVDLDDLSDLKNDPQYALCERGLITDRRTSTGQY